MWKQEKKKQIYLRSGYNNELNGKVIDKVSFYFDGKNCTTGELLITFTDNTYILLSPQWDNEEAEYTLQNDYIQPLNELSSHPGYVIDNEFHWDGQFQRYIDCGIVEFDENIMKGWVEAAKKRAEEYEYQQYLKLKEKYESE